MRGDNQMGKVSNALKLYMLLQSRGMMKIGDIATELGVSPRMVKNYREDLEEAGIYIGSVLGRHGGYYLESHMSLKGLGITQEEYAALRKAQHMIKSGNYHYGPDFETLTSKILSERKDLYDISYYSKGLGPTTIENKKEIWKDINKSIEEKRKLQIEYAAIGKSQPDIKIRTIHPYGLCDHKGATYIYGYCEIRKQGRTFKVCRIMSHKILREKFIPDQKIDFKQKINDSFGIYNDEPIELKLTIRYPMSQIVKEKVYAANQKIEDIDETTISFEAKIGGYTEIKKWVMGMGSLVEVIGPLRLKEDIKREARKVLDAYN